MQNEFGTGTWTGYYEYPHGTRDRMDLYLEFAEGRVYGYGSDPVGGFTILGTFDNGSHSVWWEKRYISHTVHYRGTLAAGSIVGEWQIPANWTGTFRLWRGSSSLNAAAETAHASSGESRDRELLLVSWGIRPEPGTSNPAPALGRFHAARSGTSA